VDGVFFFMIIVLLLCFVLIMDKESISRQRLPTWMKMKSRLPKDGKYTEVRRIVDHNKLHTICSSGNCPNIGECWSAGTATFMILGEICTRSCKFCGVKTGKPLPVDLDEPARLAQSIKTMGIKHAVITSVDRDDLEDKGSGIWSEAIKEVKRVNPGISMETLIPDFDGVHEWINRIIEARPEVISHNLETVKRLSRTVRSRAKYELSLKVIKQISESGIISKSGIMLGLGETREEILDCMDDLREAGCQVFTLGQYLRPSKYHIEVEEWISPEQFEEYREIALSRGFRHVESHPLVRSSYHAEKHIK
jgi:lipoic acid synthetase